MKKQYFSPEMQELELEVPTLLAGSDCPDETDTCTDDETVCTTDTVTCSPVEAE